MAAFSGAVKLLNVSDFIAPSQACVVNLDGTKKAEREDDASEAGQVKIQPHAKSQPKTTSEGFDQAQGAGPSGPVTITLNDCLACSGCITSAETMLLEHQGLDELRAKLKEPGTSVVVSISAQSRAALAALYDLRPSVAIRKLSGFLKSLGVSHVFDLGTARDLALVEACEEFVQRYRAATNSTGSTHNTRKGDRNAQLLMSSSSPLPMLASACPGWVCYAEKTQGAYILPYISHTKSPQAVMGTLVKRWFSHRAGISKDSLYHVSVMPCYDKKLEASREDFLVPGTDQPEVDSCITSSEVHDLLRQQGVDLRAAPDAPLDALTDGEHQDGRLYGLPGGSGGYLEYIYRSAAKELFGVDVPEGPLPMKTLRNSDVQEVTLEVEGREVLKFGLAYGFRNIQTLAMRLKRGTSQYHYVEVMACPSGCLNGGGQPKPPAGKTSHDVLQDVEARYHHQDVIPRSPRKNLEVERLYSEWVRGPPGCPPARHLLHTQYHKREKTVTASLGDW